jgi:hypothetical protein
MGGTSPIMKTIGQNFETTKRFVEIVMVFYHRAQIKSLGLQTIVKLLECTQEF